MIWAGVVCLLCATPQSPDTVSPVLACLYAAPVLRSFMSNPDTTSILPVGPRSYVDDMGFLAISDSLHKNTLVLERTLHWATKELEALGMSIDPTKCNLMHFSWRPWDDSSPSITTTLYGKPLRITPPKYVRWLGFFLDRKLLFKHHIDILSARGRHVITGIQCLGNTIHGLNAHHLRLLFKTCVIPVITYGCQLCVRATTLNLAVLDHRDRSSRYQTQNHWLHDGTPGRER